MASPQSDHEPADAPPLPPVKLDPLAALMSYLIPGLGQVFRGRVGKGLLFFFGLNLLFFYGMWMGQWRNVWLPDASDLPDVSILGQDLDGVLKSVAYRPQFLGQFWIGSAAWPALVQYFQYDSSKDSGPIFGKYQRMPTEPELNDLQRNGSKRWDLGWVYTVIAGVLNLLVIYDALAGPMFREPPKLAVGEEAMENALDSPPVLRSEVPAPVATPNSAPATPGKPPGGEL